MNTTYVIGHKNPDTDAIAAAMAYADYKNKQGENVVPARLGPLSEETKFALKSFFIEDEPPILLDARCKLEDIELDKAVEISKDCSCNYAFNEVVKTNNKTLFVTENHRLIGIASISDLTSIRLRLPKEQEWLLSKSNTRLIADDLDGELITDYEFETTGIVSIYSLRKDNPEYERGIVVVDSKEELNKVIEEKPSLVIYAGAGFDETAINKYHDAKISLIKTEKEVIDVVRTVVFSIPVELIMVKSITACKAYDYVEDIASKIINTRFRCYPVVDDNNVIIGSISRYHLFNYEKKKFILVDHSSKAQTIDNIDQALISEIIDHHHIGDIQTNVPINYINQTRGATCSIIYSLYKEKGLIPDKKIAGMMLSAIISDTLFFKSKTTTIIDIENAHELAEIAGVDINEYANKLLAASVNMKEVDAKDLITRDLKEYKMNGYKIAIGQTNYDDISDVQARRVEFEKAINDLQKNKSYDILVMMFTSVKAEGSMFMYVGPKASIMSDIIQTRFDKNSGFDKRIMSRKQQLVPKLSSKIDLY